MMPTRLAARHASKTCDIHLSASATIVERVKSGIGERYVEERPLEALDSEGWTQLGDLIGTGPARLILSPPDVYVTTLDLPAAARGRLRAAVSLQLDHLAPLDPVLLDWNAELLSSSNGKISVAVAMTRSSRIEQLHSLFEANGLKATAIATLAHGRALKLASGSATGMSRERRVWLVAAALIASIPLTTLAGATLLRSIEEARIASLQQQLAPLALAERKAARAEALRRALKPVLAAPAASETLEALALGMPETAYARQVAMSADGSLEFTVESKDPEALAHTLRNAPLLAPATIVETQPTSEGRAAVHYRAVLR